MTLGRGGATRERGTAEVLAAGSGNDAHRVSLCTEQTAQLDVLKAMSERLVQPLLCAQHQAGSRQGIDRSSLRWQTP